MDNIVILIDKILPLLSTLLGGFITYFITKASAKNELRLKFQIEARDKYWIPCSIAIENLYHKIEELQKDENSYISFRGDNSCEKEFSEIIKYLKANKRIFFYEKTKDLLISLEKDVEYYEDTIDNDVQYLSKKYEEQYKSIFTEFDFFVKNRCIDIEIKLNKSFAREIKNALLHQKAVIWMGKVESIDFYREDDLELGPFFVINMTEPFGKWYYKKWDEKQEGFLSQEDLELLAQIEGCNCFDVLDFENKHKNEIKNYMNKKMEQKDYHDIYIKIFEDLLVLKQEIFKNIDSIGFI